MYIYKYYLEGIFLLNKVIIFWVDVIIKIIMNIFKLYGKNMVVCIICVIIIWILWKWGRGNFIEFKVRLRIEVIIDCWKRENCFFLVMRFIVGFLM